MGRSGGSLGRFAMLSVPSTAGVPCSGHRGHPSLILPDRAPSSPPGGLSPYMGRAFPRLYGHCDQAWRDSQVTCSAKDQTGGKKKGVSFTLNNQYEVHVHPRLLLFATSYRSSTFRPQMSFRLMESLFTPAGLGSGPAR